MSATLKFYSEAVHGHRLLTLDADGKWKTTWVDIVGYPNGTHAVDGTSFALFRSIYGECLTRATWDGLLEEARQSQAADVPSEPAFEVGEFVQIGNGAIGEVTNLDGGSVQVRLAGQAMGGWFPAAVLTRSVPVVDKVEPQPVFRSGHDRVTPQELFDAAKEPTPEGGFVHKTKEMTYMTRIDPDEELVQLTIDVMVPGRLVRCLRAEIGDSDANRFFAKILEERYAPKPADDLGPKSFPELLEEFEAARSGPMIVEQAPPPSYISECRWCHEPFEQALTAQPSGFFDISLARHYCGALCHDRAVLAEEHSSAVPERRVVATSAASVNDVWVTAGRVVTSVVGISRNGWPIDITMDGGYDIVKTLIERDGKTYVLELVEEQ